MPSCPRHTRTRNRPREVRLAARSKEAQVVGEWAKSVDNVFAETMYMNSSTEELNWGRRSTPQEASCSKRKHDTLEPDVGSHRQRSQKKANANVLQNFFPTPFPSHMRHLSCPGGIIKRDEIMQNEHPPRGSASITNQTLEDTAQRTLTIARSPYDARRKTRDEAQIAPEDIVLASRNAKTGIPPNA